MLTLLFLNLHCCYWGEIQYADLRPCLSLSTVSTRQLLMTNGWRWAPFFVLVKTQRKPPFNSEWFYHVLSDLYKWCVSIALGHHVSSHGGCRLVNISCSEFRSIHFWDTDFWFPVFAHPCFVFIGLRQTSPIANNHCKNRWSCPRATLVILNDLWISLPIFFENIELIKKNVYDHWSGAYWGTNYFSSLYTPPDLRSLGLPDSTSQGMLLQNDAWPWISCTRLMIEKRCAIR